MSLPPPPKPFVPGRRSSAIGEIPPDFVPPIEKEEVLCVPPSEPEIVPESQPDYSTSETSSEWQARVDPASGNTYYFNTITEETTWANPFDDTAVLAAAPVLELVTTVEDIEEDAEQAALPSIPISSEPPRRATSASEDSKTQTLKQTNPLSMPPSAISFVDVHIKYRFTSARRLVTIQLDELKLTQQVTATKMKENLCSEVDLDSFDRPKGPLDGLLTFKLTTSTADDGEDEEETSNQTAAPMRSASMLPTSKVSSQAMSATMAQGATFFKGLRAQSSRVLTPSQAPAAAGGAASTDMYTRTKQFQFKSPEEADSFVEVLCLAKTYGFGLRTAFQLLDPSRKGSIEASDITNNSPLSIDDAYKMIALGDVSQCGSIDFASFFSIFLDKSSSGDESLSSDEKDDPAEVLSNTLNRWLLLTQQDAVSSSTLSQSNPMARAEVSKRARAESASIVSKWASLLLPGETLIKTLERVRWRGESMGDRELLGTLRVTSYRIIFSRYPQVKSTTSKGARRCSLTESIQSDELPEYFHLICLPLTTINKLEFAQRLGSQPEVRMQCKDMRLVRVALEGGRPAVDQLIATIKSVAYPGAGVQSCFAFRYTPHDATVGQYPNRWDVFDLEKEFSRIGFNDNDDWRIFKQDFKASEPETDPLFGKEDGFLLSPTYPEVIVLPSAMTNGQIISAAQYRSRQRLPAATWMDRTTGAVLCRSSQTMAGLGNKKNQEDINLLEYIRVNNGRGGESSRPLYIADCRGRVAATGNKLQGKGAENVSNYTDAHLCFCDILNIHTMRDSQAALAKLLYPETPLSDVSQADPAAATSVLPIAGAGDPYFLRKLEDCGWLGHVALVLSASKWTAQKLHQQGASVLVHCSDGWDRTAQVCGLAQILLDPFYRTIEGFAVLIEKEWLAFGHKFHERTGHAMDSNHKAQERSPIFVQWVECVAHVLKQFPSTFEFTEALLLFVADHLHSCLFGNFLGDTDMERKKFLKVKEGTTSIWSHVLHHSAHFTNDSFTPYDGPIWPNVAIRDVCLWRRYYLRHTPEAHPNRFTGVVWSDDYGSPGM